jgi:hypothetical protein
VRRLLGTIQTGLQLREDFGDRAAFVAHGAIRRPRAMEMSVDDPGHHHPTVQIGHRRARTRVLACVGSRADEDDTTVANGQCLREAGLAGAVVSFRACVHQHSCRPAVSNPRVAAPRRP